ncbi:hypothetical protein F7725_013036 [Dissostichus mawsoni]|uniref:Centrosomal protein of 78 kDa n=1 Tax=Dissostichus mawsoni TaxID=36200 RepID=A0A7J5YNY9_DISMA|nr:hypothetical protein F7725_013036 [Dissostichus mawsoni]
MVQDSAHIRGRGGQDFFAYYDSACARQESVPLPAVKMNLGKGMLDFNGDRVRLTDWPPILNSICINKHLHHIAISSTYQASLASGDADKRFYKSCLRKRIPAFRSKDMTFKLCKALRECLTVSPNLKTLQLNGLPLRERDLITLTKGFAKSVSLENLSLANCPISDEGLEGFYLPKCEVFYKHRTVDFTGCNLTWRGAEHMANIIKHQGMQRHGTAWAESLRYRHPQFEGMGGLRRVTLNCNTLIGDRGAAALAHELAEDLWVKAVDLQRCGLSNEGARRLLEALKTNSALCVLDIRSNPLIDKVLIKTVLEKVLMNADRQSSEPLVKDHLPEDGVQTLLRPRSLIPAPSVYLGELLHELNARATVKVTMETDSEADDYEEVEDEEVVVEVEQRPSSPHLQDRITERKFNHLQMELKECRLRLAEERRARLRAESRLMEYELDNARLRDNNLSLSEALAATCSASAPAALSALEDEAVLESIESSFTKFHAFLDLLKDAGLGQLASMAGIDKSDFHPPGRPQLSSTLGRGEYGDGLKKTDAPSLVDVRISPAPHVRLPDRTVPRSPPSVREFLREDRLRDVLTSHHASGPAGDPCVGGEEEPDHFSKPDTQQDSGSEHSFRSQKSFDKVSFGKTFQSGRPKSNSNSPRISGSHRYSYAHSHSLHSNSSHGGLSVRSSVSDIISDKAD